LVPEEQSTVLIGLTAQMATDPDDIAVLAAEADGDVVSAAWLVFRPGTDFASLRGGATQPGTSP
jgi:hypothetical protein